MSKGWDAHIKQMTEQLGADLAAIGSINGDIWSKNDDFNLTASEFQLLCKVAGGYTPSDTETLSAGGIPLMIFQGTTDQENGVKLVSKKGHEPLTLCSIVMTGRCVVVALKSGANRDRCVQISFTQAMFLKKNGF